MCFPCDRASARGGAQQHGCREDVLGAEPMMGTRAARRRLRAACRALHSRRSNTAGTDGARIVRDHETHVITYKSRVGATPFFFSYQTCLVEIV